MTLTPRGKVALAAGTVTVLALGAIAFFTMFPSSAPAFVQNAMNQVGLAEEPAEPPTCPLTGEEAPGGVVPSRPALAIKVENAPEARPQSGLQEADVVYEEPVEGGYTRFIALYQCGDADRVGPVRSGRLTDPDVLVQFGAPVMGYAGGVNAVKKSIAEAGLVDVNYIVAADAYTRDEGRAAPHNLYTTTDALYRAGRSKDGAPEAVFAYAEELEGKARKATSVHLPFSTTSDVYWAWSRRDGAWMRSHGTEPHVLEDGTQVSAANVVVMLVDVHDGAILDAAGNPSPEVTVTGSGKAYVFRDGKMILARWERPELGDVTRLFTKTGAEVALAPGNTWIELLPSTIAVEASR